jgi:transcription-repair coupling factor (superfamily II helicase)
LRDEVTYWNPQLRVLNFAEPAPLPYETLPWGPRTVRERITALAALAEFHLPSSAPRAPLVIVTSSAWMAPAPRQDFLRACRSLTPGASASLDSLARDWTDMGYLHEPFVLEPGQFSRRGGILDVWPPAEPAPARLEFFGGEIDTLRGFDPGSQRSTGKITALRVTPAREMLARDLAQHKAGPAGDWPSIEATSEAEASPRAPAPSSTRRGSIRLPASSTTCPRVRCWP